MKKYINKEFKVCGMTLLKKIPTEFTKCVFFDPQYRGVMDKMKYGNEGARQKERSSLPQMTETDIKKFIEEIFRVLRPSGYLFLWVDKFHLCEGVNTWLPLFKNKKEGMEIVDLLTWDKGKIGMGYRTRRKSEYLVIIQKLPKKAKLTWTDRAIPDVWLEKIIKKEQLHPHQKPLELLKRLVQAVTVEGDTVVDPAAGSFLVKEAANSCSRDFIGGDVLKGRRRWR